MFNNERVERMSAQGQVGDQRSEAPGADEVDLQLRSRSRELLVAAVFPETEYAPRSASAPKK